MMGERDPATGKPTGLLPIGNVPELTMSINITAEDHKESWSGARGVDDSLITETGVTLNIAMESFDKANMIIGLNGEAAQNAADTGASYSMKIYTDKWMPLPFLNVSSVTISGSVEDTDFEVDEAGGMIKGITGGNITDGTTKTVTFDHGAMVNIQALVTDNPERYFVFNGLNTKDGKAVRLEVFRLQTKPFADFGFITDNINKFTIEAKALADTFRTGAGESKFFQELIQI